jgi:hypothetical protein
LFFVVVVVVVVAAVVAAVAVVGIGAALGLRVASLCHAPAAVRVWLRALCLG